MSSNESPPLVRFLNPVVLISTLHQKHWLGLSLFLSMMIVTYVPFIGRAFMIIHGTAIYQKLYLWTAVILLIAYLCGVAVYLGWRQHRKPVPGIIISLALMVLTYVIIYEYNMAVEISGFALVGIATWLDYKAYSSDK